MSSKSYHTDDIREEFINLCLNKTEKICQRGYHYICSVDGSNNSHLGYQNIINLRKKYDFITIFHAYKDNQDEIPIKFNAESIKERYENEINIELNSNNSVLCWEPRHNRSVIDTLKDYITMCDETNNPPHFIVLGHTGRKVDKVRNERGYFAPLSSNCDWVLRTIQLPAIIAKREIPLRREKKVWMMAVDGTIYSNRGLDILFHLVNPKDTLIVFHICNDTESNEQITKITSYYEDELATSGPVSSQFILVEQERGIDLGTSIVNYVNDTNPDLFALGPRARATLTLSPITEHVINNVNCSIIVCKN